MFSLCKMQSLLCLFIVTSICMYIQTAPDEIFKKTVRTKRPNKLKEEIAQTCILCLEYTTEILDIQAQLQNKSHADSYYNSYRLLADIQRALYARIKELAESDKDAYINQSSGKELQQVATHIDAFVMRNKHILAQLKQNLKIISVEKTKNNNAQFVLDQSTLLALLEEEKKFFCAGCKCDPIQKNIAIPAAKK